MGWLKVGADLRVTDDPVALAEYMEPIQVSWFTGAVVTVIRGPLAFDNGLGYWEVGRGGQYNFVREDHLAPVEEKTGPVDNEDLRLKRFQDELARKFHGF